MPENCTQQTLISLSDTKCDEYHSRRFQSLKNVFKTFIKYFHISPASLADQSSSLHSIS